MFLPLDGPSVEDEISVGTGSPTELKVSTSPLEDRKVVTFQPLTGKVRWGFSNSITSSTGFTAVKSQLITIEASDSQPVYIIAESGTVDVYFAERA
jgi:hypothetical protein